MLYRIIWNHCRNNTLHIGPVLYITARNGSNIKLRPYTKQEALAIVKRYNNMKDDVFHEVEEITRSVKF